MLVGVTASSQNGISLPILTKKKLLGSQEGGGGNEENDLTLNLYILSNSRTSENFLVYLNDKLQSSFTLRINILRQEIEIIEMNDKSNLYTIKYR